MTAENGEAQSIAQAMADYTRRVDYPLPVVTVGTPGGEISGCLAGFVTQCSLRPPRFLVCISKVNHTFFVAERSEGMAIHLLGAGQTSLASLFGEATGDSIDKFGHCDWRTGVTGAPVLAECLVWLEGTVMRRWSVGDHQALLMRPLAGGRGAYEGGGLLTLRNSPDLRAGHP